MTKLRSGKSQRQSTMTIGPGQKQIVQVSQLKPTMVAGFQKPGTTFEPVTGRVGQAGSGWIGQMNRPAQAGRSGLDHVKAEQAGTHDCE